MTAPMPSRLESSSPFFKFHPAVEAMGSEKLVALARQMILVHVERDDKMLAYSNPYSSQHPIDVLDQDCFWRKPQDINSLIPVTGLQPVMTVPTTHFMNLATWLYHPTVAEILAQTAGHAEILAKEGQKIVAFSNRPATVKGENFRVMHERGQNIAIQDGATTLYTGLLPQAVAEHPIIRCRGKNYENSKFAL